MVRFGGVLASFTTRGRLVRAWSHHDVSKRSNLSDGKSPRRTQHPSFEASPLQARSSPRAHSRAPTQRPNLPGSVAPLEERLGLHVAPSTLHSFIKVRARHRKQVQFELPPATTTTIQGPTSDRVAAFKAKSVGETKRPRFTFRENELLTLSGDGGAQ